MPATLELKLIFVAVALQIVSEDGVAVATGIGLTVTTALVVEPVQPFNEGVIVYVTVPFVTSEFVRV